MAGSAVAAVLLLILLPLPLFHPVTIHVGYHGFCVAAPDPGGQVSVSAIRPVPPEPRFGSNVFEEISLEARTYRNGVILFDSGASPLPPFAVRSVCVRDHWLLLVVW
jgi:hypothetical protein